MGDLKSKIERYQAAGRKAVDYQLQFQQPDGGYIWEGYANDAFHKQAYSWQMSGEFGRAHKLLNWVKRERLGPDGQLAEYNGDCYKHAWFFHGAHRLARFDLSYPVFNFLASSQAECGGLPLMLKDELCRSLATAWTGVGALSIGRMDVAEKVAAWCIKLLDDQPEDDKFYCQTTRDGKLVTLADDPQAAYIDYSKPKQAYWEVALPMQLFCRLHMITGEQSWLDLASRCFELHFKFYEDRFTYVGSGKTSLASALYYLLTDDTRGRDAVCAFGDMLVETQYPEGGWRDETEQDIPLIYIDHAAEFNVWLQEDTAILLSKV